MLEFQVFEAFWALALAFTAVHSAKKHGWNWSARFLVPLLAWGLILEEATVAVLKGYYYPAGYSAYFLGVPVAVSFGWAAVIYWARELCFSKKMPLAKASLCVAIAATVFDAAVLEPLAWAFGLWVWTPPSAYFGAPLGNFFAGWLSASFLYVFFFEWLGRKIRPPLVHGAVVVASLPLQLAALQAVEKTWVFFFGYH